MARKVKDGQYYDEELGLYFTEGAASEFTPADWARYHKEETNNTVARMLIVALLLILLVSCLGGCSTITTNEAVATSSTDKIERSLVKGSTTKEDVAKLYGPPGSRTNDGFGEVWTYYASTNGVARMVGAAKFSTLIVMFDDRGLVRTYTIS